MHGASDISTMEERQPNAPDGLSYGHLEDLLKQTLEVAKANHKLLKRMERNALIGFVAKIVIWLIVLGVPIIFLSSYVVPLFTALSHGAGAGPANLTGLPSLEQLQQFMEAYQGKK